MATCDRDKRNLGVGKCNDLPRIIRSIITTPKNWSVSLEDSLLQATWEAAMLADKSVRIYKWPEFMDVPEFAGSETVYQRNAVGVAPVVDGTYEWLFQISKSLCFHKAAFSHRSNDGRVILIDDQGNLYGTSFGAGFGGFSIAMLHTENLRFADGSVASSSPVRVALASANEINHDVYGMMRIQPEWNITGLNVLTDVELTIVGTPTATTIVVDVNQTCDGEKLLGLEDGDFVLLDANGDAQTITGATENNGRYTLTGVGLESGTLDLAAPATLSIKAYENVEPVTVTIA